MINTISGLWDPYKWGFGPIKNLKVFKIIVYRPIKPIKTPNNFGNFIYKSDIVSLDLLNLR